MTKHFREFRDYIDTLSSAAQCRIFISLRTAARVDLGLASTVIGDCQLFSNPLAKLEILRMINLQHFFKFHYPQLCEIVDVGSGPTPRADHSAPLFILSIVECSATLAQ